MDGPPSRPNIVSVLCDRFRQAAVGCCGQDPVVTPTRNRFAEQSLVLTHFLRNQPVCTPYRGALFCPGVLAEWPFTCGAHKLRFKAPPLPRALRPDERVQAFAR